MRNVGLYDRIWSAGSRQVGCWVMFKDGSRDEGCCALTVFFCAGVIHDEKCLSICRRVCAFATTSWASLFQVCWTELTNQHKFLARWVLGLWYFVTIRPVYSDTTQLNSTRRPVEFSWVELRRYGHPHRRNSTVVGDRQCNWPSCSVQPISAK